MYDQLIDFFRFTFFYISGKYIFDILRLQDAHYNDLNNRNYSQKMRIP